jgi:hypothetical protein
VKVPGANGEKSFTMRARPTVLVFGFSLFLFTFSLAAHTQSTQANRGVIRLKVKYKSGDVTKELPRKRFFLIKGSLDDNKSLVETIKQTEVTSRECYYRSKGASEALINWLRENDCESVYCREIEDKYLTGSEGVPEFKAAYDQAQRELQRPQLARRWLPNYLPANLRDGYYSSRQQIIDALTKKAESSTGRNVISVMTDRKGTAYLTDLEPGIYTISNLVGSETDKSSILWICEREVKPADLSIAMRRPFTLSNEKDPKVKCEVIERPLPVCVK